MGAVMEVAMEVAMGALELEAALDLGALELEAALEAMDHLMVGIVVITKDLLMQRLRLIHSITMAIITRAMGTITGCPIATTMDTTRGLLKLMQQSMTRGLLNLKLIRQSTTRGLLRPILMRSIMDIIQRALGEVMACPIAETMGTVKGLLMLKLMQKQMQTLMLMQSMGIMDIIPRAMGEAMGCPIATTMDTTRGLQKLKQRLKLSTITMDSTPRRVMDSRKATAPLMVATTKGLLMLKLKQRQMQRLKLSTITMDITPRKVTAPLMVATTKGLLKRNPSSITTDMAIINLRAMAMDIRGEVSCPEISSPRSPITITTTTTNEVLRIPAQIWSVER